MISEVFPIRCRVFSDERVIVVLTDPRGGPSKFRGKNDSRKNVTVIRIDGCCIRSSESKACDYLLLVDGQAAFFIELKGSDVEGGIKQMFAVLDAFESPLRTRGFRIHIRIVSSRVRTPNIIGSAEARLRKRLGNVGTYKCQTRLMEEPL